MYSKTLTTRHALSNCIWEARNRHGEMFGKDRFREIIRRHAKATANEILEAVYSELNSFTLGPKSEDDLTLVVIKILASP